MDKKLHSSQTFEYLSVFQAITQPCIVFAADYPDLTIIAQNDAHAAIALKSREDTIGKKLLQAFPDTSEKFINSGISDVVESIHKVITTARPDSMPDIEYDLFDKSGNRVIKYWSVTHHPIKENGKVTAVFQETIDITKQKQVASSLDEAKIQLDQVLATGKVGIWTFDITHESVTVDSNLAAMFGLKKASAGKGLPLDVFINLMHPHDRDRIQKEKTLAIESRSQSFETEYRIITQDGVERWVLSRGSVKVNEANQPVVFSGTAIDITDRKKAERSLLESERRLRFMADSMPQLVWITRPDGYNEYFNNRWHTYTGTKHGTTEGEGWNNLLHKDDQAHAMKVWKKSLKTGEPYETEYRLFHAPSNHYRWVIGRAMPLKNEDGTITKWYGTCTDIDDKKRLADRQQFLSNVSKELSSSLDAPKLLKRITDISVPLVADWCTVDLYDEERGFEQVSVSHVDRKKVALAKQHRNYNPLNIQDNTAIPRMIRSGQPEMFPLITEATIRAYYTDEKTIDFMLSLNLCSAMIVPLKDGKKIIGGMTFISSDSGRYFDNDDFQMAIELAARVSLSLTNAKLYAESTEDLKRRRELERQLRHEKQTLELRVKERTKQLQLTNQGLRDEIVKRQNAEKELDTYSGELTRSNQELENFAYVASHDLQEPLRKIQAFGNLLLTEYGDSLGLEGADYLKRMHSAASRMSILIEDLLAFSRVTRKEPVTKSVDLNDTINDVKSDLETRISDTHASLKIGKLPTVMADPTHMHQLFQNVIGNAIKFHRPDIYPIVTVRSRVKNQGYEITITDNGIGFDEKYLDRIFAVFQRLNERSSYEGTGIGLAVCRKIVERYDGTITAVSTKTKGSTFIIWLPRKKGTR